jgi:hypothetical protein
MVCAGAIRKKNVNNTVRFVFVVVDLAPICPNSIMDLQLTFCVAV